MVILARSGKNGTGRLVHFIILIFFITFQHIPLTLCQSANYRPKIGLALSGGGSCGIAHVGVLKVMEESGLRPDFISGVSMGSIIGGLYSIGYSADSLEKILKNINWNLVMSNKIPENKIYFLAKRHFDNSVISFPLAIRKSVLPSGLNNGQQIENLLSFYSWPSAKINDFTKLPTPYMCLATNLLTCKTVELTKGYLPDAMRASSAVPTFFTPIKINNVPLLDGGMVRNFAASEVKNMGADIVIGSYTGSYLSKKEELESITDILAQLFFSVGVYDFQDQRKFVDILIEPKTDDISSTLFTDIDTIIQRGYRAALPYKGTFKRLADSLNLLGIQKSPENILDRQLYAFDRIILNGNKKISQSQIMGVLGIRAGQQVNKSLLKDKIELLYGKAWFDKVKYRIVPRNDSLILMIDCTEAPKSIMYCSVHYDNSLHSGLVIGLSIKNPLVQKSLIDLDTYIGHFYKASLNYYQFISRNQKYSLSANFYTENTYIPRIELYGIAGGTFNRVYSQSLSVNDRLGLNHMVSLSVQSENRNLIPDYVSLYKLKRINHNFKSAIFEYNVNTLDNKHFPTKGTKTHFSIGTSKLVSAKIIRGSETIRFEKAYTGTIGFKKFFSINGSLSQYFPLSEKWTIGINGNILYISDTDSISSQNNFFFLGGFESINNRSVAMVGFHPYQIPVRKMAGIGLSIDYELINKVHLDLRADIFDVKDIENPGKTNILKGIGLGAGYMSIFGPLRAGLMYGFYNHERYFDRFKGYITLGYNF